MFGVYCVGFASKNKVVGAEKCWSFQTHANQIRDLDSYRLRPTIIYSQVKIF